MRIDRNGCQKRLRGDVSGSAIIHMNGRVYSPDLGRMLSPDPVTQAPEYGQNYNRYTYAFNNPLKFTDPSGFANYAPTANPVGATLDFKNSNNPGIALVGVSGQTSWIDGPNGVGTSAQNLQNQPFVTGNAATLGNSSNGASVPQGTLGDRADPDGEVESIPVLPSSTTEAEPSTFEQGLGGTNIAAESISSLVSFAVLIAPQTKPLQFIGVVSGVFAVATDIIQMDLDGAAVNLPGLVIPMLSQSIPGFDKLPQPLQDAGVNAVVAAISLIGTTTNIVELAEGD